MLLVCADAHRELLPLEAVPGVTLLTQGAAADFHLRFDGDTLRLHRGPSDPGCWVPLDELRRRQHARTELVRACCGRAEPGSLRVLDPFTGWGVDALCLAARGARVLAGDALPAACLLTADLARRAGLELQVNHGDALARLKDPAVAGVDVVYLDPMFPARRKQALPGKRLQYLAALAPPPLDLTVLLRLARRCAGRRVVLKRRLRDPVLGTPNVQVSGRTVRYDVYPAAMAAAAGSGSGAC